MHHIFKFLKHNLVGCALASVIGITSSAAASEIRLMDIEIIRNTKKIQVFIKNLMAPIEQKRVNLDLELTDLQKEQEEFEKNKSLLDNQAIATKSRTLEQRKLKLQGKFNKLQQEMEVLQHKMMQPIHQAAAQLRTDKGWDMILVSQVAIDANPKLDVTQEVVTVLNKMPL